MKTLAIFFVLTMTVLGAQSLAQTGSPVGNGGDATLCDVAPGKSEASLFDYFEARLQNPGFLLEMGTASGVPEKINHVLNRLAKVSPQRAARYRAFIDSISTEEHFIDTDLVVINDVHNYLMPKNCRLVQLAVHLKPEFDPYRRKVLIDRRVYGQLDDSGKAGLFLHEAIYNELISYGDQEDSAGVRLLNAVLGAAPSLELADFVESLKRAGLREYEYHDTWLSLYQRDGKLPQDVVFADGGTLRIGVLANAPQTLRLKSGTALSFLAEERARIKFRDDGSIAAVASRTIHTRLQNHEVLLMDASLDAGENILQACVVLDGADTSKEDLVLEAAQNQQLHLSSSALVNFDKTGLVTSFVLKNHCEWDSPLTDMY
jgi:hypothetical protein